MNYRLWTNDERTVLFRLWEDGSAEVATRETPSHTWGPPVYMKLESETVTSASSNTN